jgi:ABC-type transport system substrate-binding protein
MAGMRASVVATVVVGAVMLGACGSSSKQSLSTASTTSTTVAPPTTTTSVTVAPATTITTVVPGTGQAWTGSTLTITPVSVGAVHTGMTLAQASQAAGEEIIEVGDGAAYAKGGSYYVGPAFVDLDQSKTVSCVGAGSDDSKSIVTTDGFKLGDSVDRLKQIYGSRLIYMPDPGHGISPKASYVVEETNGYLAFWLNQDGAVHAIVGTPGQFDRTDAYARSNACIA